MKAYEVIEKPENWTKGTAARTSQDMQCDVDYPGACKYCLTAAIYVACVLNRTATKGSGYGFALQKVSDSLQLTSRWDGIEGWNDAHERTHAEVYNLLKSLNI